VVTLVTGKRIVAGETEAIIDRPNLVIDADFIARDKAWNGQNMDEDAAHTAVHRSPWKQDKIAGADGIPLQE
jgi:hypothetical protein